MRIFLIMFSCFFLLGGCNDFMPNGQSHTVIDWVDFIKLNGKEYTSIHTGVIANPKKAGPKIGSVKFKVSGNIHDGHYQSQNGDAAFLDPGTRIYEVEGYPNHSVVAVKDADFINGYKLYYARADFEDYLWHFKDMPKKAVEKIEIYKVENLKSPKQINKIKNNGVKAFLEILNGGDAKGDYQPNQSSGQPQRYAMVFYTDEAIAYQYYLRYDDKHYYWSPWSTVVLPDSIQKYLQ
ncbi:MAG TPA: hypothetical protein VFT51_04880 [Bacillales bacterium]|nr:hypothetical protein [Bacillales bacterium]